MRLAFVGCGFVADYYARAMRLHPGLEIAGVMDRDGARAGRFAAHHGLTRYPTLEALLGDPKVELVLNLTNPASHFAVSKAALEAGKHVYSEKPLSLAFPEARALVALAETQGRALAGAPCNVLGATAQTMWKALRENAIGKPRLVYAELDEGPIHRMDFKSWRSESGHPWPYADEFEVGCTLEHAGYVVTWLAAFFGPATRVTSFASVLVHDKGGEKPAEGGPATPDFTVACVEFGSGVVARLTNSLLAPHDHSVRIVGDTGVLATADSWDTTAAVTLQRRTKFGIAAEKRPWLARVPGIGPKRLPLARDPNLGAVRKLEPRLDFAAGVAEVASALAERRPCRMSARLALHVNEIVLAIQDPAGMGSPRELETSLEPMSPMPWAV